MSSIELKRLARRIARIEQAQANAGKPQLAYSSIENGNIKAYEGDELKMSIGLQDDGSTTIRHIDGPVPPVPSGVTVHVDGPIVQVSWDGTFKDEATQPLDWSHLKVEVWDGFRDPFIANITSPGAANIAVDKSGFWAVAFRAVSLTGKVSEYGYPDPWYYEVKLVDLTGAIEAVQQSANGKNQVRYSGTRPTSETPGIEGDTWFVNEADPETGGMLITQQWQFTGGAWRQTAMTHQVIASVDLGKATVGELDGIRIRARTVTGEILAFDAIDGMVITGPTIQTARAGARVVLNEEGLSVFDENDDWRVRLTPDLSTFKGDLEAQSLVATGPAEFRDTGNKLGPGAKLLLEAGIGDPTAPPLVQPFWDSLKVDLGTVSGNPSVPTGLAWDGTNYWTLHHRDRGVDSSSNSLLARRLHGSTGAAAWVTIRLPSEIPWVSEEFGVTCIGQELFWLGRNKYDGVVWVTDLNGNYLRHFPYANLGYSRTNPLTYKPGIGNDGTNIVIAHCADAGNLLWRTFTPDGAQLSTVDAKDGTKSDITGVYIGPADWGGETRATFAKASTKSFVTFSTNGTYDPSLAFNTPNSAEDTGIVFAGGNFRSLNASGLITKYENTTMGDGASDWWAVYRWAVDLDRDGLIDQRSRISPPTRFTWPRRSRPKFIGAQMPAGVGFIAPSIAKKTSTPVRTDFRTVPFNYSSTTSTAWYLSFPADWQSRTVPADGNTFPKATPATIMSASSTFEVNGDGSGRWGPVTFATDGTATGIPKVASGIVRLNIGSANGRASATVTLPAGLFSTAPSIQVTARTQWPVVHAATFIDETTTSFVIWARRDTTGPLDVSWTAIGE